MTRKIRRSFTSLLALAVLLFTGCADSSADRGPDRSALPPALQNLSFEEHMDITVGYWDIENMSDCSRTDLLKSYIEELFNITIIPYSVSWANYKERYQILSTTNSLPDVFATLTLSSNNSNDSAFFFKMITNGSIRPLPDDLSAFPSLNELMNSVSYTRYTDGHFYALPRMSYSDPVLGATDSALLIRRDWMEALGCAAPESFEEFAALMAAFAQKDPDGNGLDDTLGYNANTLNALGKWLILGIAPQCNVYSWVEQDGLYVPSWTTEAFDQVVASYRLLYETGGLDPDFYTKAPITILEDFASGRLGALEYKSSPSALLEAKTSWNLLNEKPFEECVAILPIFPAPDGIRYSNSSCSFWSESYLASTVDEAKAQRILALYEFLLSPQGQELCTYGLKGTDYRKLPDGSFQCLLELREKSLYTALLEKYPSLELFSTLASWNCSWRDFEENSLAGLIYGEDCRKLAYESVLWCRENTVQISRPYDFLLFPKEPSDRLGTSQAFNEFVKCIIGTEDPVEMWHRALEKMYRQGLEEYIQRQNNNFNSKIYPAIP